MSFFGLFPNSPETFYNLDYTGVFYGKKSKNGTELAIEVRWHIPNKLFFFLLFKKSSFLWVRTQ